MRQLLAGTLSRWGRPRVYRARHGLGQGFKQIGGVGLALPGFLRPSRRDAESSVREERFLRGLELAGETVYDVGAFEGTLTMFFAAKAGPVGRVVAFEPHPRSVERLLCNLKLNRLANVTVREIAIGSEPGELMMLCPPVRSRASGDDRIKQRLAPNGHAGMIEVELNSLDNEIASNRLPDPEFVKVDVEGMELDVLRGMRATIIRCKPKLYIELHGADPKAKRANARRVVGLLIDHGYLVHHVDTDQRVDIATAEGAIEGHLYCE